LVPKLWVSADVVGVLSGPGAAGPRRRERTRDIATLTTRAGSSMDAVLGGSTPGREASGRDGAVKKRQEASQGRGLRSFIVDPCEERFDMLELT
jgi:hypothetical protein